jgi:hypothetical protein
MGIWPTPARRPFSAENVSGSRVRAATPGSGAGKRTFAVSGSGGPGARIAVHAGAKRFGGTMRLVSPIGDKRAHRHENGNFVGNEFFYEAHWEENAPGPDARYRPRIPP